eukprot:GHVQ01022604.1.p1 GENE.GHVQ01022604.1~~GHVQ01022604.1.p1  ORF type:complete len:114 (-),score=10.77 GHVQ01022604.1:213-554(-)
MRQAEKAHIARQPPHHHMRLSKHYDIVSHAVTNAPMLDALDTHGHTRKDRYSTRYKVEAQKSADEEPKEQRETARRINRISPNRFEATAKRGHDIISNQDFQGRNGRKAFVFP